MEVGEEREKGSCPHTHSELTPGLGFDFARYGGLASAPDSSQLPSATDQFLNCSGKAT